jgi:hypothetical protein
MDELHNRSKVALFSKFKSLQVGMISLPFSLLEIKVQLHVNNNKKGVNLINWFTLGKISAWQGHLSCMLSGWNDTHVARKDN